MKQASNIKGFTLAELLVATTILLMIILFSSGIYVNFFGSIRNIKAANLVYEEARFTMERLVKEMRSGTVDYEEYHNQNVNFSKVGENKVYGQNYCQYSRQFYTPGFDELFGTTDDESVGLRNEDVPPAISSDPLKELYLVDLSGKNRTYIKRFERDVKGEMIGRIGLLKLEGFDFGIDHVSSASSTCPPDEGEKDGRIDTWHCADGFACEVENATLLLEDGGTCQGTLQTMSDASFVDITPVGLDVVDLNFSITPKDDPRKAYADSSVQNQPQITVQLVARASKRLANEFRSGRTPDITLESTVSSRVYNEIVTECNLKECLSGQQKACPAAVGVCGPKNLGETPPQQSCQQAVWPGCSVEDYETYADDTYGLDTQFPGGAKTFYENTSEVGSCEKGDSACMQRRCTDGLDNDCNGYSDSEDAACLLYLCSNGTQDTGESCTDVGGFCDFIRPKTDEENGSACFDRHDNDCDGVADEFDASCRLEICSNGLQNPPENELGDLLEPFFAPKNYPTPNYLAGEQGSDSKSALNEVCPDVGGLCSDVNPLSEEETGELCYDNLDNDCNGLADELDPTCQAIICSNGEQDCGLVPQNYTPANILTGFQDLTCKPKLTLDEECADAGGLCGGLASENTAALCSDGKDNDCSGDFDGNQGENSDAGCCPDADGDLFSALTPLCSPSFADAEHPNGKIDCNDLDSAIKPGAVEICDDARYPADYLNPLLANEPIDNNCSFANGLSGHGPNALDRYDPACCIDSDGDGYGAENAYIFFDNQITSEEGVVLCGFSGAAHQVGKAIPDCNDNDPTIHPQLEEVGALCNDGKDNNCNGLEDAEEASCNLPPAEPES